MSHALRQPPLAATLGEPSLIKSVLMVLAGSLLMTLAAKVSVPFFPVPMTMQTFVAMLIGFTYGARLGGITLLVYLAEGAMGLPVFSGTPERGVGIAYLMGPTGGYLLGFFFAACVTGALAERGWDRSWPSALLAAIAGLIVIYAPGLLWLGSLIGWDKPVLALGLWPFVPGEILKLALLAMALPLLWKATERRR